MKRIFFLLICFLFLFTEAYAQMVDKMVSLYVFQPDWKEEIKLSFLDGDTDLPYVSTEFLGMAAEQILKMTSTDSEIKAEMDGKKCSLIRKNGSRITFDFERNSFSIINYELFRKKNDSVDCADVLAVDAVKNGQPYLFKRVKAFERLGGETNSINLDDYGITLLWEDGKGYVPLQTFSDLVFGIFDLNLMYNGEFLILCSGIVDDLDITSDFWKLYYSVKPRKRSRALADFTYNEMCMMLDINYGMKDYHEIDSFDTYIRHVGLYDALHSTDPLESNKAVAQLLSVSLRDGISYPVMISPYAGAEHEGEFLDNVIDNEPNRLRETYVALRKAAYPDGVPGYEEVGNTAYITVDTLKTRMGVDYYEIEAKNNPDDTLELIFYANQQIHRENSPVENIVLDLSCYPGYGGDLSCVIALCSWLQNICSISIDFKGIEACATTVYWVDANLNHKFEEAEDTVSDKNIFCLTSKNCFSYADIIAEFLKEEEGATLIGRATQGGSCLPHPLILADGSMVSIAGKMEVSMVINGTFYSTDAGTNPDFYIKNISSFYDRKKLTEYINSLIW